MWIMGKPGAGCGSMHSSRGAKGAGVGLAQGRGGAWGAVRMGKEAGPKQAPGPW